MIPALGYSSSLQEAPRSNRGGARFFLRVGLLRAKLLRLSFFAGHNVSADTGRKQIMRGKMLYSRCNLGFSNIHQCVEYHDLR